MKFTLVTLINAFDWSRLKHCGSNECDTTNWKTFAECLTTIE